MRCRCSTAAASTAAARRPAFAALASFALLLLAALVASPPAAAAAPLSAAPSALLHKRTYGALASVVDDGVKSAVTASKGLRGPARPTLTRSSGMKSTAQAIDDIVAAAEQRSLAAAAARKVRPVPNIDEVEAFIRKASVKDGVSAQAKQAPASSSKTLLNEAPVQQAKGFGQADEEITLAARREALHWFGPKWQGVVGSNKHVSPTFDDVKVFVKSQSI